MHAACSPQNDIQGSSVTNLRWVACQLAFGERKSRNPRQPACGKPQSMGLGEGHKFVAWRKHFKRPLWKFNDDANSVQHCHESTTQVCKAQSCRCSDCGVQSIDTLSDLVLPFEAGFRGKSVSLCKLPQHCSSPSQHPGNPSSERFEPSCAYNLE